MKLHLLFQTSIILFISLASGFSPDNSYAPSTVSCPNITNLVRNASSISPGEAEWLEKRKLNTKGSLRDFLTRASKNFSDSSIISEFFNDDSNIPKIGVACSGGGYRAMLSGAGMLAAMDNRTNGASDHGLGGLLQSTTYLSGLSGGAWLVGSLAWNNWTSVQEIIDTIEEENSLWDITYSIASPGGTNTTASTERWERISADVAAKAKAGFPITLADYWGRALAYEFFPTLPEGGVGYAWSSLRDVDVFQKGMMPFPISVADFRSPNTSISSQNSSIFEFNPFEIGSWDGSVNAFSDIKYLGTETSNGVPVTEGQCVEGFDNAGFIIGTSSTLFNPKMSPVIGMLMNGQGVSSIFEKAIANDSNDVANYAPNPFKDVKFATDDSGKAILESDYLYLADGGEDGETLPLVPLLQQNRNLDIIIALDSSSDTLSGWPDGSALVSTYERQFSKQGKNIAFPYIPDQSTFETLGLNKRPTFFGCDANNLTNLNYIPPLVVYIPNSAHSFNSNQSTYKMSYTPKERLNMIENGFEATTMGNLTQDSQFMSCIGCAIIRRKQQAMNITLPEECDSCFSQYCWTGNLTSSESKLNNQTSISNTTAIASTVTLQPTEGTSMSTFTKNTSTTSATLTKNNGGTNVKANSGLAHLFSIVFASLIANWII